MNKKHFLSIVIVNYNTGFFIKKCLNSLYKVKDEVPFEVIVSDNGSTDKSVEMIKRCFPWVILLEGENEGFAKGCNRARKIAKGDIILFLNPDTIVKPHVLEKTVNFLDRDKKIGALTCKLVLPNGALDKDVRRSFPTPFVSFTHLLRIDRIFPKSPIFARYWYGYLPEDLTHEVDVLQGAFFMVKKSILDRVGWFDEGYFFDGEDIDLSWQIKKLGYKLFYYPEVEVIHYKGVTKGKSKLTKRKISLTQMLKARMAGINSMERFYRKNLWGSYPILFNIFVVFGIRLFGFFRFLSIVISYLLKL